MAAGTRLVVRRLCPIKPSRQTLTHCLFPKLTKDRRSPCGRQTLFRLRKSSLLRESTPDLFLTLARIPQPLLQFFRKRFLRKRKQTKGRLRLLHSQTPVKRVFGKVSRLLRPVGPGLLSQNPSPGFLSQGPYGNDRMTALSDKSEPSIPLSPCQECKPLRSSSRKRLLP